MRFSRLQHNVIVRERKRVAKKRNAEGAVDEGKITYSTKLLHSFENIGGYSGVSLSSLCNLHVSLIHLTCISYLTYLYF